MNRFLNFYELNEPQKAQYRQAILKAFPPIISESPIIKKHWSKLEIDFPEYQFYLVTTEGELIGFMNTIPFQFKQELSALPDRGWDWMFEKGIHDRAQNNKPNFLGGLQVIVRHKFQAQGYSKKILSHIKREIGSSSFQRLIIPIRPTKKHEFPEMPMSSYMRLRAEHEIYDPWIRTHLKNGAQVIKVCPESMIMTGDIKFWESILEKQLSCSGKYRLEGALELITIDIEANTGSYVEPNIWIAYP